MFIKRTRSKNFTYLSVVETFREGDAVKHKTLLQLGREDQIRANGDLQRLVDSISRVASISAANGGIDLSKLEETSRHQWGAVAVYRRLWNKLDLTDILSQACKSSRRNFDLADSVFATVLARLMRPGSKLQVFERQDEFLGVPKVTLHQLYRTLDTLSDAKDDIERRLFEKQKSLFNLNVDIVLYDVTTLYFESVRANDLREFGYSKDAKFGEVQVVLGLLTDTEGRPIGFDVFPGNTFEGHTLIDALKKLKQKFSIRQVVVVADRGMNNKVNLAAIKEAGFDYIVGSRLKNLPRSQHENLLDRKQYSTLRLDPETGEVLLESRSIEHANQATVEDTNGVKKNVELKEMLVCTWSKQRADKDAHDRALMVEKAGELLQAPSKIVSKRGPRRFISTETQDPSLNQARIDEDARWDGFYGIQCSRLDLSQQQVLDAYHSLWKIEDSFRVLKHSLQTRPIFHWNPKRIKGHLVTCFMAFVLERALRLELKKELPSLSPEALRNALATVQVSVLSVDSTPAYLVSTPSTDALALMKSLKIPVPRGISSQPPITFD